MIVEIRPFDPTESITAAAAALRDLGAPFALIGGLALDAWGLQRATKDADFAVPVGMAEAAADRIATPTTERRALRIGGVALRDRPRDLRIDLIDRRFQLAALFRAAIDEANVATRRVRIRGVEVPLISLENLLAMKMASGEPKDDADVRRLLGLEGLDYRGARALVETHLGFATANRLDNMAREASRPEIKPKKLYTNGDDFGET